MDTTDLKYKKWSWRVCSGKMKFYDNDPDKQVITEIEQSLLQLGIPLLNHYPGHPRGKVNRMNQLNGQFQNWFDWYNKRWVNRDTEKTPEEKKEPSVFKKIPKDINLDDVFCLKDERKVDKTNSFSFLGKLYTLNHKRNLVGRKVKLYIHPEKKIRVWYNDEFIEELNLS